MTLIKERWTSEPVRVLFSNFPSRITKNQTFAVNFLTSVSGEYFNGFYKYDWNEGDDDEIVVVATSDGEGHDNFTALQNLVYDGTIVRRDIPAWKPHTPYMIGNEVWLKDEEHPNNSDWTKIWTSVTDYNSQAVFQPNWEYGAVVPEQRNGLFTFPTGKLENIGRARRLKGAPYYAWDVNGLYIHTGKESLTDHGYVSLTDKAIKPYEKGNDSKYGIGDVVSGELMGRVPGTDNKEFLKTWGIFRRAQVYIWAQHDSGKKLITSIDAQHPSPPQQFEKNEMFYVQYEDYGGAFGYDGVYRVYERTSIHLGYADTVEFDTLLRDGLIVRLTDPYRNDKDRVVGDLFSPIYNYQGNHTYMTGDRMADVRPGDSPTSSLITDYSHWYTCNYDNYVSPEEFDYQAEFLGWDLLANIYRDEDVLRVMKPWTDMIDRIIIELNNADYHWMDTDDPRDGRPNP